MLFLMSYICWISHNMGLSARNPLVEAFEQLRLHPALYSASETSKKTGTLHITSLIITLPMERLAKALLGMHICAGWSTPFLFACKIGFPNSEVHDRHNTYEKNSHMQSCSCKPKNNACENIVSIRFKT